MALTLLRDRFRSDLPGGTSWHAFSFGPHYDPARTSHGPLVLLDEHVLEPGAGFDEHLHRDVEVVTWVVEGVLVHDGPAGRRELRPGSAQRLRAGTGALHAERAGDVGTTFVQAWLLPGERGLPPADEERHVPDLDGRLVTVAGPGGLELATRGATLRVARLGRGEVVRTAGAPREVVLVARGAVGLDEERLAAGQTALAADAGSLGLTALAASEVLVWEMDVTTTT